MNKKSELVLQMYRADFLAFVAMAFAVLHPGSQFLRNWHIDLIADHLRQIIDGKLNRLAISIPPRSLKSHIASIAFTAFLLGRNPAYQIILVAGSRQLGRELINRLGRLMGSDRYRSVFPHMSITTSATEIRLHQGGGLRLVVVGEQVSGRGADLVIVDDPLSPSHALDEKLRSAVNRWYDIEIMTRLNNRNSGAIVILMQRVHPDDLCGHVARKSEPFLFLSISAIALRDEEWRRSDGSLVVRRKGELIDARRENVTQLQQRLNELGAFAFVGQYLQGQFSPWIENEVRAQYLMEDIPEGWSTLNGRSRHFGFYRVTVASEILIGVFGIYPSGPKLIPYRPPTLEEWEADAVVQQARLVAEVNDSFERERASRRAG